MSVMNVEGYFDDVVAAIQHMHRNLPRSEDVKFISDDKEEFSCHSTIAATYSSFLEDEIYLHSKKEIEVNGVDVIAIQNMIKFFYEEDVVFKSVFDITETKKLADDYHIFELSKICIRSFSEIEVNLSNVISVFKTAIEFNDTAKESECFTLISENKEAVFTSQPFISLEFENVLQIFEKLRDDNSLTESAFLHFGMKWIETNDSFEYKDLLMEKIDVSRIPLKEYATLIIPCPVFFTNAEITHSLDLITKSSSASIESNQEGVVQLYRNAETNTEGPNNQNAETNTEKPDRKDAHTITEKPLHKDAVVNTEKPDYMDSQTNTESTLRGKVLFLQQLKQLTVQILKEEDGVNLLNCAERVKLIVDDGISIRCLQFELLNCFKKGLIGAIKTDTCIFKQVDISYEGIYYMIKFLQAGSCPLSPLHYIEVFRAAEFFNLEDLKNQCMLNIMAINDCYDTVFLEALNFFNCFKDTCSDLLTDNSTEVMMHPNFITCDANLICLLLDCNKLRINNESQLLFTAIQWLEVADRQRFRSRSVLLNKLAFESISVIDFQYAITSYPNFFEDNEKNNILAFKTAKGKENIDDARKKLPLWYNFKRRKYLRI